MSDYGSGFISGYTSCQYLAGTIDSVLIKEGAIVLIHTYLSLCCTTLKRERERGRGGDRERERERGREREREKRERERGERRERFQYTLDN